MKKSEEALYPLFVEANELLDKGDRKLAYQKFLALAKEGYGYAFNTVGVLIESGVDKKAPKSDALQWYRRAARLGDSCGAANLGTSYVALGKIALGKKWLARAMSQGDYDAGVDLAHLYLRSGKRHDEMKAKKILQVAIESGTLTEDQEMRAKSSLKGLVVI